MAAWLFLTIAMPNFGNMSDIFTTPFFGERQPRSAVVTNAEANATTGNQSVPKNSSVQSGDATAEVTVVTVTNQDKEIVREVAVSPDPDGQSGAPQQEEEQPSETHAMIAALRLKITSLIRR